MAVSESATFSNTAQTKLLLLRFTKGTAYERNCSTKGAAQGFTKVYPQPSHPVWIFSGTAHSKVCLHQINKISKQFWKTGNLSS